MQNSERKLGAKRVIFVVVALLLVVCVIFCLVKCNDDSNVKDDVVENIKLSSRVEGLEKTHNILLGNSDYDFLRNIKYDKNSLLVEVDATKIKFDTVGTYDIEFKITDLKDSTKTETVKSKVNIVDNNKKDETSKPEETDKTETSVETEKPQVNENDNVVSKPTTNQNTTKPTEPTKPINPTKPQEHKHTWVDVTTTVRHEEQGHYENVLVKDAWDEQGNPIYEMVERSICNTCGEDITGFASDHILNGICRQYHSEWKSIIVGYETIHRDAIYEQKWIVDTPAWDETIVTGQKCSSCGTTK